MPCQDSGGAARSSTSRVIHRGRLLRAITHPTQISAELNDIPASRVYGRVDFAPDWARWPYSQRVKLAIGSPRLTKDDTITVTAWTPRAMWISR